MSHIEEETPEFFKEVQELAKQHDVVAYVVVGVVLRDGKAVVASAGGSKLPDVNESTLRVYESMDKAFDQMVSQLATVEDRGLMN